MSALNGKWLLDRIENGDEFLQKLQIPEEDKQKAKVFLDPANEITQEIEINGQNLTINISAKNGWSEEDRATFGHPVEQSHFGREFTALYKLVGDTIEEHQKGMFEANITRKVEKSGELVMTIVAGDAHCKRIYKRL
ncbi:uncharacterized protein LOC115226158 [Octopus sinensis]|uniref:Uncharacterized protein LOC115226158 n=1 Tax=Octopus sinensis TaxID=2607531 RepID=A0A6P7TUK7_9MOLL|nr:uncharacterized protein LOC115226158 [Octopus sinensis]